MEIRRRVIWRQLPTRRCWGCLGICGRRSCTTRLGRTPWLNRARKYGGRLRLECWGCWLSRRCLRSGWGGRGDGKSKIQNPKPEQNPKVEFRKPKECVVDVRCSSFGFSLYFGFWILDFRLTV